MFEDTSSSSCGKVVVSSSPPSSPLSSLLLPFEFCFDDKDVVEADLNFDVNDIPADFFSNFLAILSAAFL